MSGFDNTAQEQETTAKNSTKKIIQGLKEPITVIQIPRERSEEINSDFLKRLTKLNLGRDPRMLNLLASNPKYGNRLISLFKILKEINIPLTGELEDIITKNISNVGGVVNLLMVAKELDINPNLVPLNLLFKAAKSDSTIAQSARAVHVASVLDLATFNLMLTYPQESLQISQFILDLQAHAYSPDLFVNKLHATLIAANHMSTTIQLLNLLLDIDTYDVDLIDILARQQQYIDIIYEGAKKLAKLPDLLVTYFYLLEENPQNANIFAKNILLLNSVLLLDPNSPKESLRSVSKLGVGAFHFMKQLLQANMLNGDSYNKICRNNGLLDREDVVQKLINLPLMTTIHEEQLKTMLDLVGKPTIDEGDVQDFNEIISEHHFSRHCSPTTFHGGLGR